MITVSKLLKGKKGCITTVLLDNDETMQIDNINTIRNNENFNIKELLDDAREWRLMI